MGYSTSCHKGGTLYRKFILPLGGAGVCIGSLYWLCMSPYSQLQGDFPYHGDTDERLVAITFDDGPNQPYTSQIASLLADYGIKATFFQPGACVERYPEVTQELFSAGHVIGSHAYSHQFGKYLHLKSIQQEIEQADAVFAKYLGVLPSLYRPPWLLRIPGSLAMIRSHFLQPVSGEFCHSLEVFQPNPTRIARGAVSKAKPGAFILFHDGFDAKGGNRSQTVKAVKITIERLSNAGYGFTTVDKLLGVPAYRPLH